MLGQKTAPKSQWLNTMETYFLFILPVHYGLEEGLNLVLLLSDPDLISTRQGHCSRGKK